MGAIIKSTQEKEIKIFGLSFKPESVYLRLRPVCHFDGKAIEIEVAAFENKEQFKNGAPINVMFKDQNGTDVFIQKVDGQVADGVEQGIAAAHDCVKDAFIKLGYDVELDLGE